jgi:tetratricopeptide (TPR) repeat protein
MSGFRLFRRKKLVPGLTLNLSRSGPSLRIGGRGAGVTIGGRSRLRTTVGIPGSGIYYTKTAGGGRRVRRRAVPIRSAYSTPTAAPNYKGLLYAFGVVALIVVTIATYGLILIPAAIGLGAWIWYRRRQPDSIAARIVTQAMSAQPPEAVALLNQALEVNPHGLKTLAACANWFFEHQCYQDAAEAYAGLLHIQADLNVERKYVACLLGAGRADEATPRLESLRSTTSADDGLGVAVLNELATAYFLKGDPAQALAFIGLAPLQKRNLDSNLQLCLYLRGVGRYLTGDHRHAVSDLERLYAVNPSFADVMAVKAAMQAGTFAFSPAKPYPDWYPTDHRETALPSEPQAQTAGSPSTPDAGPPPSLETADRPEIGPTNVAVDAKSTADQ